jgi:hypothetical protein
MHINVIGVTYTYIMLWTIKPTHLMTVNCLRGTAPIGLSVQKSCCRYYMVLPVKLDLHGGSRIGFIEAT